MKQDIKNLRRRDVYRKIEACDRAAPRCRSIGHACGAADLLFRSALAAVLPIAVRSCEAPPSFHRKHLGGVVHRAERARLLNFLESFRGREPGHAREPLTIHHKFRSNLVALRQKACSRWRVGCVGWHGLAEGATRAGSAATHGHEHGGLMIGRLPAANEEQGGALHERTTVAAQPRARCGTTSCAAPPVGANELSWRRAPL